MPDGKEAGVGWLQWLMVLWSNLDPHLHDCGDGRYMLQLSSENTMIALTEDDLQRLGIKDGGE